jgi:hypothetical protein
MSPVRRRLDWDNATVSPDRISVPLDGSPDDYWLDRFHEARSRANQVRAREQLPHLQIELRDGEIAASDIPEGDQESVRRLLAALVDSANRAPRAA